MLELDNHECYLINRKYEFIECFPKFRIPKVERPSTMKYGVINLFDGERVEEEGVTLFLVFDGLVINGINIMHLKYSMRLIDCE
jgi:hypothetical protein